ncbi:MAG: TIR domain-containing protein [Verrucomicrobiales bacterium]|nr:TIR domain-containing protein [Verrucomicrobiales bacterium]
MSQLSSPMEGSPRPIPERAPGRIFTFYSYKGGTGRSMSLANVAWILAQAGHRVLAIDWDLEAPGLHRYFAPFLDDPEMVETPGLIDFFDQFQDGARRENLKQTEGNAAWFEEYASLLRVAVPVNHPFPPRSADKPGLGNEAEGGKPAPSGCLHLVSAGRQGPSYAMRVAGIRWDEFYERFGGGIFLEAVKAQLRQTYDFILIDSRTGLSDTAGICTVQMPDDLVVCYTLNRQSMLGAAATAESASGMRRKPSGEYSLRVWPVAMRVELAEKDRLEAARTLARDRFSGLVRHLSREERREYWGQSEVLYFPYYAYEEVLATVADRPGTTATLLSAMEGLTRRVTGVMPRSGPYFSEEERRNLVERYRTAARKETESVPRATGSGVVRMFLSYSQRDLPRERVAALVAGIEAGVPGARVFWDEKVAFGEDWSEALARELREAEVVLFLIGKEWQRSKLCLSEMTTAMRLKKRTIPLLLVSETPSGPVGPLPPEVRHIRGTQISEKNWENDLAKLVRGLAQLTERKLAVAVDPEDPQKGRWGGSPTRAGYVLSGQVTAISSEWFDVVVRVQRPAGDSGATKVIFHLHDTFKPQAVEASFRGDTAEWQGSAWGAFTVGAEVGDGSVTLELDLAQLPDAPKVFRER